MVGRRQRWCPAARFLATFGFHAGPFATGVRVCEDRYAFMKTLTLSECVDWIEAIGLSADPDSKRVSLPIEGSLVFTVRWPNILPYQVPYFANLFLPGDPSKIDECLFLLSDNGASGELDFELACRMLGILRGSHGENRKALESPA